MLYISRGEISSEDSFKVLFRGEDIFLTCEEWELWKKGLNNFVIGANSRFTSTYDLLYSLAEKGLVCISEGSSGDLCYDRYMLLTKTMLVYKPQRLVIFPKGTEKFIFSWMKAASISLTTEELVFLVENNIPPSKELSGEKNKAALISKLYPDGKIEDNILIKRMSHAKNRDLVVATVLSMLNKGFLVLN